MIAPGTPEHRRILVSLFAAGVATFVQMYAPQALLPMLASDLGVGASASSWAVGAATIGVAIGVLPWSWVGQRIGRVRALRIAVLLGLIIGGLVPLWPHFTGMVVLRFLEGLALAGTLALAVTLINEILEPRAAGNAAGIFIAGNTIGGLLGRMVAAPLADAWGWRFGLTAATLVAAVFALVFVLGIPRAAHRTPVMDIPVWPISRAIGANLRNPGTAVLFLQGFLLMGGFVVVYNYLPFRLEAAPYQLSTSQVSLLFLAFLAGSIASQQIWRLVHRSSPTGAILVSLSVSVLGLLATASGSLPVILCGLVLFTGGFFGAHSVAVGSVGRRANVGRAQTVSLYNLFTYAGSSFIGWLGGYAFTFGGWTGVVLCVAALGVICMLGAMGYARSRGGCAQADSSTRE